MPVDRMGHWLADLMVSSPWILVARPGDVKCACAPKLLGPGWSDKAIPEARPGCRGRVRTEGTPHLPLYHVWRGLWEWNGGLSPKTQGWRRYSHYQWTLSRNWATFYTATVRCRQLLTQAGLHWRLNFIHPAIDMEHLGEGHCARNCERNQSKQGRFSAF